MKRLLILLMVFGCSGHAENETLKKASDVHNEAVKIGHDASLLVSQLKQRQDSLSVAQSDTLQVIMTSLSEWYESLVEVPGYDHDDHGHGHDHEGHDHSGHDHDHDHGAPNYLEGLTPEEVLEVQEALKREVEGIQRKVTSLARDIKNGRE